MDFKFCPFCKGDMTTKLIGDRDRNVCTSCGYIHYINPTPAVGIIAVKDGKFLFIKRGNPPGKGTWAPPSGFVEIGETLEEAAARELKEETGLTGHAERLLGAYCDPNEYYGYVITIVYLCKIDSGDLKAGDDAADARFMSVDEIPPMHFACFKKAFDEYNRLYGNEY